MLFVVGSPRSGTSFTAEAIGGVPGFADLGEVNSVKAIVPHIYGRPAEAAAPQLRSVLRRVQRLGMVAGARAIEQTPESTYIIPALAQAFPHAQFLVLERDGRDVVCSLIERGWLADGRAGEVRAVTGGTRDDAGQPYGAYTRFWVEAERRDEFAQVSEARRCAWAWRRYASTARAHAAELEPGRVFTLRYERMAADPAAVAEEVAGFLGVQDRLADVARELGRVHSSSLGRWRRDLAADQLADVDAEAGELLAEFGYES